MSKGEVGIRWPMSRGIRQSCLSQDAPEMLEDKMTLQQNIGPPIGALVFAWAAAMDSQGFKSRLAPPMGRVRGCREVRNLRGCNYAVD